MQPHITKTQKMNYKSYFPAIKETNLRDYIKKLKKMYSDIYGDLILW